MAVLLERLDNLIPMDVFYFWDEDFFKKRGADKGMSKECEPLDCYTFIVLQVEPSEFEGNVVVSCLGRAEEGTAWEKYMLDWYGAEPVYLHTEDSSPIRRHDFIIDFVVSRAEAKRKMPGVQQMVMLGVILSEEDFTRLTSELLELEKAWDEEAEGESHVKSQISHDIDEIIADMDPELSEEEAARVREALEAWMEVDIEYFEDLETEWDDDE